ncbi:MAG: hypothetical protein FWG85_00750 [Bacteroidetes bacterium]|nr:hypothetical protein [Bacteroidota bacterium]
MLIKKRNLILSAILIGLIALFITPAKAQESTQNKVKSIMGNFSNIRFSSVNYYELNDKRVRDLKEIIKSKIGMEEDNQDDGNPNNQIIDSARLMPIVNELKRLIAQNPQNRTLPFVIRQMNSGVEQYEELVDLFDQINPTDQEQRLAMQLANPVQRARADIYRMFIITTPVDNPNDLYYVPDIIGLVLCKERIDKDEFENELISYYNIVIGNSVANENNIITYNQLQNLVYTDPNTNEDVSLYDKLIMEYRQNNFIPVTAEVRGIGTELVFMNTYGKSTSLISNENDIAEEDIQSFIRITEGQPFDYFKENEVIVSPDYISWRRYRIDYYEEEDSLGNMVMVPSGFAANSTLPLYGVELKFGLDEINYPSFFSERMMVRAIWDNIKLGVILPTPGWSSFTKDVFDIDRRFTFGGLGITGAFDFPIKVIPQSGVFSMSASYLFGDAKTPSYKDRKKLYDEDGFNYIEDDLFYNDYLIRYTAQAHYTFGFAIDQSYLFRFGIGGTIYGAETWHDYEAINDMDEDIVVYKKSDNEAVGGISMKVEFMARDITTPFGVSLQYFDESLFANAWIQIPIVEDAFFLRFEAKGCAAAFKETLHPWENKAVFMPSVRLVFNF